MPAGYDTILDFWFGAAFADGFPVDDRVPLWFKATADHDRQVAAAFTAEVERALAGELDALAATGRGRLALIVLLDQFPRHIYRHTPRAFAGDAAALRWCLDGVGRGLDRGLRPCERLFFYGPMEHSEDAAMQRRAVDNFAAFVAESPPPVAARLEYFFYWIRVHQEIIARFGRFPQRNRILGRASTPEELHYLEKEAPYFGQR